MARIENGAIVLELGDESLLDAISAWTARVEARLAADAAQQKPAAESASAAGKPA